MPTFFSALSPVSTTSGITFHPTNYSYSEIMRQQDMPDLTLDVVIPFLWSRNLPLWEGIYETFTVFYGDHFDKSARGYGQKGVLDFALLPLLSRKLIADTYLEERKDNYILNFLAWVVALPIKAITFSIALACTMVMIPVIMITTFVRWIFSDTPPPPDATAGAAPMILSTPTAYAALQVVLRRLELAGICTPDNLRRLLADPQNLALVYTMEYFTHVIDANNRLIDNQQVFDFLLEHRTFWTNVNVIGNLTGLCNRPFVRWDHLQNNVTAPEARGYYLNDRQSTHTASVHSSTSKSAARLKQYFQGISNQIIPVSMSDVEKIKNYDKKLVGSRTDQDILSTLTSAIDRLSKSRHIDPESGVSTPSLLQFCWLAANDTLQWHKGVIAETATACFYATLYETEREYALSASGEDSGHLGQQQACEGGAFNKMIEGMAKIHKLCEVNFVTPATAALKLPCVVRRVLKAHLHENPGDCNIFKQEGISADLWSNIQPMVLDIMQADFSTLYPKRNGQVNSDLLALVNAGQDIDLTDLQEPAQQHALTC